MIGGSALRVRRSRQWETTSARTVVVVTRTVATKTPPTFTNAEFAGKRFVHGFCDGNSLAALTEYQPRYPDRRQTYRRAHPNLIGASSLMPPPRVRRGRRYVRGGEDVLDVVHDNP
jgi:hypothetical protein